MRALVYLMMGALLFGCKITPVRNISQKICWLGSTKVIIQKEYYGPGKVFVHVHASETTALDAARKVARAQGGQVITLIHQKQRDITFKYHGKTFSFDPNRIYTLNGIKKTLFDHDCYDPQAAKIVSHFASQVMASIPRGKVIAVHNNKGYSLRDYFPHHSLAKDSQNLYVKSRSNFRNFFLVTQAQDFKCIKKMGFNVVHQARGVTDDGSMSVALASRHYVNVEAAYGQLQQQMIMLNKA